MCTPENKNRVGNKIKLYDYVIKNDDLEKTVEIIMSIIKNEKRLEDK